MLKRIFHSLFDGGSLACLCSLTLLICDVSSLFAMSNPPLFVASRLRISVMCTLVLTQGICRSLLICIPFTMGQGFSIITTYVMHCALLLACAFDLALNDGVVNMGHGLPYLTRSIIYIMIILNVSAILLFLFSMLIISLASACRQTELRWQFLRLFFENLQNEIDRLRLAPQFHPMTEVELNDMQSVSISQELTFNTCAICLEDIMIGDRGLKGNVCNHYFHSGCLRDWLRLRSACPICKQTMRAGSRRNDEPIFA